MYSNLVSADELTSMTRFWLDVLKSTNFGLSVKKKNVVRRTLNCISGAKKSLA